VGEAIMNILDGALAGDTVRAMESPDYASEES
jgi:hypothetical protein